METDCGAIVENVDKIDDADKNKKEKFNLKGDYGNIAILLLLYVLQGEFSGKIIIITLH